MPYTLRAGTEQGEACSKVSAAFLNSETVRGLKERLLEKWRRELARGRTTRTEIRRLLMCHLLVGGTGPRTDAIRNMTLAEVEHALKREGMHCILVKEHKTGSKGCVVVPCTEDIYSLIKYVP